MKTYTELEVKLYDDSSTEEEIQELKKRVWLENEQIIYIKELPLVTPFTINLLLGEMCRLADQIGNCAYLIDLRESQIPDAKTRRYINVEFKRQLHKNVRHVSFVTGRNFFINTVARFVMYQTELESFSISREIQEGKEKIRKAL